MSLTQIIKPDCEICGKPAIESSVLDLGESKMIILQCGHVLMKEAIQASDYDQIVSSDNRRLMNFQKDGVRFIEESDGRCLIADEQGLGKTVQALAAISLHPAELLPALVATKTTIKLQWMWEFIRWNKSRKVQVIKSSKDHIIEGFDFYIITYDLLDDFTENEVINGCKTLILDECQAIKNHLSKRAKAVQKVSRNFEHIIGLSGTPIKNNAGEYFTVLNILKPERFRDFNSYLRTYCDAYENFYGPKVGGLKDAEYFRQQTSDFIIRRTKAEVFPDFPEKSRAFHHVEFDERLRRAYDSASKELEALYYAEEKDDSFTNQIAIITRMRQICGISKVPACIDFVTDFLLSTDRKITIFLHHHAVRDLLIVQLNQWLADGGYKPVIEISAEMDGDKRALAVKNFELPENRVMVASTLAAGEGLNLQFCSDAIMLERQWNPANEVQAEDRFHRFGQVNPVTVTYMIIIEMIDDYFTTLVEQKREIVENTLDGQATAWDQQSLMKELIATVVSKGLKRYQG